MSSECAGSSVLSQGLHVGWATVRVARLWWLRYLGGVRMIWKPSNAGSGAEEAHAMSVSRDAILEQGTRDEVNAGMIWPTSICARKAVVNTDRVHRTCKRRISTSHNTSSRYTSSPSPAERPFCKQVVGLLPIPALPHVCLVSRIKAPPLLR